MSPWESRVLPQKWSDLPVQPLTQWGHIHFLEKAVASPHFLQGKGFSAVIWRWEVVRLQAIIHRRFNNFLILHEHSAWGALLISHPLVPWLDLTFHLTQETVTVQVPEGRNPAHFFTRLSAVNFAVGYILAGMSQGFCIQNECFLLLSPKHFYLLTTVIINHPGKCFLLT